MNTSRKEKPRERGDCGPLISYLRDDTLGLVMEKEGQTYIYAPKKGLFRPAEHGEFTDDASALSFESAKRLWENTNRHYASLRE